MMNVTRDSPRFNFLRLMVRNLKSHQCRAVAVIIAFTLIAATLFSTQYLDSGAAEGLDHGTAWLHADLMVVPDHSLSEGENSLLTGAPAMFFFNDTDSRNISRIPGVANASPEILVATLSGQPCCSDFVQIIAIDPANDFSMIPRPDNNGSTTLGKDDIIIGSLINGSVGSDLRFYGHTFHITGKLGPTGMRGIDYAAFIRIEDAYTMADGSGQKAAQPLEIPRGKVSMVLVQLDPGADPQSVGSLIQEQIPGTRILTPNILSTIVSRHLSGITLILEELAVAVAVLSLVVLGVISIMLERQMKREVTLLGALGATKSFILRLILAESFSASVIGSVVGICAAAVILVSFQDFIAVSLQIPLSIPPPLTLMFAVGSTLILTLVISGITSLYPTIRIVRSGAYENIRDAEKKR
jgi:putative ABC transport system permease protein